jgi:hypothetical protein
MTPVRWGTCPRSNSVTRRPGPFAYREPHSRPSTARFQITALPCANACRIAANVELGPIPPDVRYVSQRGAFLGVHVDERGTHAAPCP